MKQQSDVSKSWWNNKIVKWKFDETANGWKVLKTDENNKLAKWKVGETSSWRNEKLVKEQVNATI